MERVSFARRAARLSSDVASHGHGEAIPFDSGHAFPGILPDLIEAAQAALSEYRAETLQYAPRPGLPELREWIADYMREDGADVAANDVLVVNGAKHGLELVCRLLLDEGDSIVVTAPTYFTAIPIFRSFDADFIEAEQDGEGLDVEELERGLARHAREGKKPPKFIYNVPDFHNPTGLTMSRRRRDGLLDLAARHGTFIVEDSPYREIRFEGAPEPSIKGLDGSNTVIGLGTFSKLIAPGLRIGWVTAPRDILARMVQLKSDGGSCPLTQRIIVEFCRNGGLAAHAERVRRTYRTHRDRAVDALRRELPEASMTVPEGGYYLWLTLPGHIDGDELARRANEKGVSVIAGSMFFAGAGGRYPKNQGTPKNHVRIAYSHAGSEEIDEGVRRLARAYRAIAS